MKKILKKKFLNYVKIVHVSTKNIYYLQKTQNKIY